jgi:hypothetical protein
MAGMKTKTPPLEYWPMDPQLYAAMLPLLLYLTQETDQSMIRTVLKNMKRSQIKNLGNYMNEILFLKDKNGLSPTMRNEMKKHKRFLYNLANKKVKVGNSSLIQKAGLIVPLLTSALPLVSKIFRGL